MTDRYKYPRTVHLPWSPGRGDDDLVSQNLMALGDREVVVTEKMDGENTTLYHDGYHARSIDSRYHPSRAWLAGFHASRAHHIPDNMRICGENLYARHSLAYNELPSYFLGFSVWERDRCYSWSDTLQIFDMLDITPVRELYRGPFKIDVLRDIERYMDTSHQEGYVVRATDSFRLDEFGTMVRKFVRANHVQTDQHWTQQAVIPNRLKEKDQ